MLIFKLLHIYNFLLKSFVYSLRIVILWKIEELAFTENHRIGFYGKLKNWLLQKIIELAFTKN